MEVRPAARLLVVSPTGRVLLLRGGDPHRPGAGTWWITPGGGVEPGETVEEAARRELAEETGLEYRGDLGPVVLADTIEFEFAGVRTRQHQQYFLIRTEQFEVDSSRWTETDATALSGHRWWSIEDLRTTPDIVYPEGLVALLEQLT